MQSVWNGMDRSTVRSKEMEVRFRWVLPLSSFVFPLLFLSSFLVFFFLFLFCVKVWVNLAFYSCFLFLFIYLFIYWGPDFIFSLCCSIDFTTFIRLSQYFGSIDWNEFLGLLSDWRLLKPIWNGRNWNVLVKTTILDLNYQNPDFGHCSFSFLFLPSPSKLLPSRVPPPMISLPPCQPTIYNHIPHISLQNWELLRIWVV